MHSRTPPLLKVETTTLARSPISGAGHLQPRDFLMIGVTGFESTGISR